MNLKIFLVFGFLISFLLCCSSIKEESDPLKLSGAFIGQIPPEDSAKLFAPNLVSGEYNVRDAALSPDGNDFFYSMKGASFYSIIHIKRVNNIWQNPEVASFSGKYSDIEPCFSPDGQNIYFVSNRPLNEKGEPKDYDIWYTSKINGKWGSAKNLGAPINTEANEFYPSFVLNGTLYFCANYENGIGGEDLYYSKNIDGNYKDPVNLGDSINSVRDEFNSFVSPDEKFIMFTSMGWGTGFGGGDLWISFRKKNAKWTRPINMGEKVNSSFFEYCPSLTPDGKYMFFTSNRSNSENYSTAPLNYNDIINNLSSTLNGSQNVYWIDTKFINELK